MKIFFTAEYEEEALKPLYELGEVVKDGWALGLPKMSEEELVQKTADADMIITSYDEITRRVIEAAPALKLIACTRATPVNIDIAAAKERGITVLYTPGRNSDTTAEMTIGLMLSIARTHPYITELDNVVITPHIGGATTEVLANHTRQIVGDVRRFLAGEPLLYEYR